MHIVLVEQQIVARVSQQFLNPKNGINSFTLENINSNLFLKLLLNRTPRPGFEPGHPEGNKISSLAQYQIVPPWHKVSKLVYIYKSFS